MTQRRRRFLTSRPGRIAWRRTVGLIAALAALAALPACVPIAGMMGLGPTAVQTAAQLDQAKLMVDGASIAGSGKTLTDHAISIATGYDCSLANAVKGQEVCAAICR